MAAYRSLSQFAWTALAIGLCASEPVLGQDLRAEWLPTLRCAPTGASCRVDGALDDPCWADAVEAGPFVTLSGDTPTLRTRAWVTHDGNRLLVGIECADPDTSALRAVQTSRDADVWTDDCVELFIDADLDFRTYYHLLVNAANVQRDERGDITSSSLYDVRWNADWESAVHVGDAGWTVEIAVPFAAIGVELLGETVIGLNICREAPRASEVSSWTLSPGGFHNPHRHGLVVLSTAAASDLVLVEPRALGQLSATQTGTIEGSVTNVADRPLDLTALVRAVSAKGTWQQETALGLLPIGATVEGALAYELTGTGSNSLYVELRDPEGQIAYASHVCIDVPLLADIEFGATLPAPGWGEAWWCGSTYKVLPTRMTPSAEASCARLSAAAREYECFQIVLRPRRDLHAVDVSATAPVGPAGSIPLSCVRLYEVAYVPVKTPSDAFGHEGLWPDPLVPITGPLEAPGGTNTVVWVEVYVPPDTGAGDYAFEVTIAPAGEHTLVVPVELRVHGFSLTKETHTRTAYGLSPVWSFLGVTDPAQQAAVFEKYLRVFREHRLACYDPFAFHPIRYELCGPGLLIAAGDRTYEVDALSGTYVRLARGGAPIASVSNTIAQFEREGVGWQGTGLGWPGIDRLKEWRVVERSPGRIVVDMVGEHVARGEANRAYEITFRFVFVAGRPVFGMQLLGFRNSSATRYELQGYFGIVSAGEGATHHGAAQHGVWLRPDGTFVGAYSPDERPQFGGPIYVRHSVWLEPGEATDGFGPPLFIMVGHAEDAALAEQMLADACAGLSDLESLQPDAGQTLAVDERTEASVSFDFAAFDAAASRYLDVWGFNGYNFPAMPGEIAGYRRFTPEFVELHRHIYAPMIAHLRDRGWLEKAYSYWFDEPTEADYPYVTAGMDVLERNCVGLTRLLTEQVEDPLIGHVDLWVPVLSAYDATRCQERQAKGDLVWWYVCCGPRAPYPNNFIDHPAINHRIRYWMMEKYGVTGDLYWSTTHWLGKDWALRSPWESAEAIAPDGGGWGCGDGVLLYPACREPSETPVLEGPVITQRIGCIRDGLEDLEYFWTLKQLVRRAEELLERPRSPQHGDLEGALAEAREALAAPNRLARSLTEYSLDPQDLLRERDRLATAIEALQRAGVQ